jgi:hypothetical protein
MLEIIQDDAVPFLLVTVILGGGAAWLSGRAIAQTWRPWWQGMLYMFILGGAVRFRRICAGYSRRAWLRRGRLPRRASAADGAPVRIPQTAGLRLARHRAACV